MIAIAVGLLLLVSAASAQGNNNIATVDDTEVMTDNLITGASFIQSSDIEANLLGNGITATQFMFIRGNADNLAGLDDGDTFILQSGDMMLNDTGNANFDLQVELLGANENLVTQGNITQAAAEVAENVGNDNDVVQFTGIGAGVILDLFGSPNVLTGSEIMQLSSLDVSVTGNLNTAVQANLQAAFDNTMTDSRLWQQNVANAEIAGNGNIGTTIIIFPIMQGSLQIAADNTMTESAANQLICQNENIAGNTNVVGQLGIETMTLDVLTDAGVLQKINEDMDVLGNINAISQIETLTNTANTVTGGNIVQQADVFTSS